MLLEELEAYAKKDIAPFHMPGHKRNTALLGCDLPYDIDITEIDGFDNLQDMQGILKAVSARAASLYGCDRAYPLVGGSTAGILAGIKSAVRAGDTIILARNCHKSVFNAVELFNLRPVYVQPETDASGVMGSIRPEQVLSALDAHPDAALVVVTSPTYAGVVSDIRGIAESAHRRNVPLLVDGAHGAHLGFSDTFPPSAVQCGADIVVTSVHKTLPALTQTALALCRGDRSDPVRFQQSVNTFQTSSPSYVLLASIDRCLTLLEQSAAELFERYEKRLAAFDARISGLRNLRVLCHGADRLSGHEHFFGFDPGKIVIRSRDAGMTGAGLAAKLREAYRIELEMAGADTALAMTSICDKEEHVNRLAGALCALDDAADTRKDSGAAPLPPVPAVPELRLTPAEAERRTGDYMELQRAPGCLSLEYVWAYPPGVPLLVPGEIVTAELAEYITALIAAGVTVKSSRGRLSKLYAVTV